MSVRLLQTIGIALSSLAAGFVMCGMIRPAIAALVAVVFLIVWNLDVIPAATKPEKKS